MTPEETLEKLGFKLPTPARPLAAYVPTARAGDLVFVAGQLPLVDGALPQAGRVGADVTLVDAQGFARIAALNALAALKAELGELSRVKRVVRVGVFVASDDAFTDQPKVANGASELLQQAFGERGRHARAAVGVNVLPLGAPVEVEMMVQVE